MKDLELQSSNKSGFFDFINLKNNVSKVTDYDFWVWDASKENFRRVSQNKLSTISGQKTMITPIRYGGKKLSRNETKLLLNAQQQWGEYITSKPEYVDSILAMYRSSCKNSLSDTLGKSLIFGMLATAGLYIWGSAVGGILTSMDIPKNFDVINPGITFTVAAALGFLAKASEFIPFRRRVSSSRLYMLFGWTNKKHIHPDFLDFYEYLKSEWDKYSVEDRKSIGAKNPVPAQLEEYRSKYKKLDQSREASIEAVKPNLAITGAWENFYTIFDTVKKEWSEWEMDILKVVQYPALFDMREPVTVEFHRALITAESLHPRGKAEYSFSHPFIKLVTELQISWTKAKNEAQRIQQSNFTKDERVRLSRALDLLNLALNTSGTPAERQSSYKQALKQMDGLVHIPAVAMVELESGVGRRGIESTI